ncbi:hypothetical protein J2I47_19015 [Fibrella sp. HMF5335]|uniref:Transposase (putative) YhgA-like domain-containing protein n=1 Tax=Fibrella rubiginis TaxID=2817060 RepID=A0A939K7I1_9BACT|nr:hypothetical protein [Fibrella rubiginis]MBO0938650.1 hypothetical protein [Fibrella rubiginis]
MARKTKSYDRIFRENIEQLVVPLANRLLNLTIPALEEIPDDLHQTIERKPDFLKKVIHPNEADNYILHFEFQTKDDDEMQERMLEYYAMLYRKYHLPVKQYVFYIGEGMSMMRSHLFHDTLSFRYELINASEVDYHLFLNSSIPEEVLLTVLGDFKQDRADYVLAAVVIKLEQLVPRSLRLKRYIKQLEILSNLRNLQELTIKISEKMALVYDLETDIRFKQGIERGIEQGRGEEKDLLIKNLLHKGLLNDEQIAEVAEVSVEHVQAIARQLANT